MNTDKIDPSKIEDQVPEKKKAAAELKDSELDRVSGGGMLSNSVSDVLKGIADAAASGARKP